MVVISLDTRLKGSHILVARYNYKFLHPIQLQDIVSFGLLVTGHVPECSPLVNCTVLMCIAFLPIFPVTLFRNLTALQFITYFRYVCNTVTSI